KSIWQRARAEGFAIEPLSSLQEILSAASANDDAPAARALPPILVDGLFGIGLDRALDRDAAWLCTQIGARGWPVVAVDVPSGIDADTGARIGGAEAAA